MIAPPIPDDEAQRLKALRSLHVLDTPPEERFDRIVRLLKRVFQVPMAFISLVDADRQWFKAASGMPTSETPRSISFCGYTVLGDRTMVVPDALEDERFRDNPQVLLPPHIRFYAGHPLRGEGGQNIGSLCLADRRPRTMTEAELETLGDLARIVERELQLLETVRLQEELIASRRHLTRELAEAARYVRSLLPAPAEGPVRTRWRFEPSSELGGDSFGYDWIDPDHFALYLLDVSGHGVGAAMMSVSAANALRSRSLPDTDFLDPSSVLTRLNDTFEMSRHDERYFTIWYGVYERSTRRLDYAAGGHPPALLLTGASPESARPIEVGQENFAIGMIPGADFRSDRLTLDRFGKLFIFSDGAYEVRKPGGSIMTRRELAEFLAATPGGAGPDDAWRFIRDSGGPEGPADDVSLLEAVFA